jgi:RNA polymerase sigma-70 factor (ECF subfamily)
VRNLSLDKYKSRNAQKRGSSDSATVLLSELEDCIPSARNVEDEADGNELKHVIDSFLETLREEDTVFFMRRYWHGDQIAEIAKRHGVSIGKVKMSLHRTRKKLKEELGKRGYSI